MHVHLDPVGGIAGDMFVAALLDVCPQLQAGLFEALDKAGVTRLAQISCQPFTDQILTGVMVDVTPLNDSHEPHHIHATHDPHTEHEPSHHHSDDSHYAHHHHHRHHADIVKMLDEATLDAAVRDAAKGIFHCLAEAESEVHGVDIAQVAFHEVGNWDSIADIVSAAWLIVHSGVTSWSCSALPIGRGRVEGAHGVLPIPAPATALLLKHMPVYTDAEFGERITPTGAAIIRYLNPEFGPQQTSRVLIRTGNGFGHKRFKSLSNVLRVLCFDNMVGNVAGDAPSDSARSGTETLGLEPVTRHEQLLIAQFEIDDQTSEDLAVAIDGLREQPGVLDVLQIAALGKKNRLVTHVQLLINPSSRESVEAYCFEQTTTLGIRWQEAERSVLIRDEMKVLIDGHGINVKQVRRPSGIVTRKADIDDVRHNATSHQSRQAARRLAEDKTEESQD